MSRFFVDIVFSFIFLGIIEAVVKPIAIQFTKKSIIKLSPLVLHKLDLAFPSLLKTNDSNNLELFVRNTFSELSGEDWSDVDIDYFWKLYDPRVTFKKLSNIES